MPIITDPRFTQPVRTGLEAAGAISPEFEPVTAGQRILGRAMETAPSFALSPTSGVKQLAGTLATGALSGAAAGLTKEATGSDLAAGLVGAVTPLALNPSTIKQAITEWGSPKVPKIVKMQTLQEAHDAGYVVPPSMVKSSFTTNRLESVAGKAAVKQEAAIRNQEITNKLAAKSLGLPDGTPLSMGTLETIRGEAGKAYQKLSTLRPGGELRGIKVRTVEERPMVQGSMAGMKGKLAEDRPVVQGLTTGMNVRELRDDAGKLIGMKVGEVSKGQSTAGQLEGMKFRTTESYGPDVPGSLGRMKMSVQETRGGNPIEELKQARADASTYYRHHNISGDPKSLKKANVLTKRAEEIEDAFEQIAQSSGRPELITEFRAARTLIAKTYDIERALNLGDGNVSATIIGRLLDQGKPLTGELRVIGKFAQAFPSITREGSVVPMAGVSGTDAAMSAVLGTAGYGAAGGPAGLVAAGLPLLRSPARSLALSSPMQNRLIRPPAPLGDVALQSALAGRAALER
jgi:hypothetical protein